MLADGPALAGGSALAGAHASGDAPDAETAVQPAQESRAATVTARPTEPAGSPPVKLTDFEEGLLNDLFAVVEEHADEAAVAVDRERVREAFVYACQHHADQRRRSGEEFIVHPVSVAKICAGMRLDTETLCAALLHDTVEDTQASLPDIEERFGEEIAGLVDGVTKLTGSDLPVPRRGPGRELPQDDGGDGLGHPGHPDQARRSPAQHAHDRRDAQAEADRQGA